MSFIVSVFAVVFSAFMCGWNWGRSSGQPCQEDAVKSDGVNPINGWIYIHQHITREGLPPIGRDLACKRVPWASADPAKGEVGE